MGRAALLEREQHWTCPNCTLTEVTREKKPHTRFHACRGLKGITAPMVPDGVRCKVEMVEREDYIGDELIRYDGEGRAVMNVTTTRDDGQDCAVFAPLARGSTQDGR